MSRDSAPSSVSVMAGLSSAQAAQNYLQYGANIVRSSDKNAWVNQLIKHFVNPLVILMLVAAGISFVTGAAIDAVIIVAILFLSTVIDFYQEYQSDQAVSRLRKKVALTALVRRDGKDQEIPVTEVTLGDVVILSIGSLLPADLRIVDQKDLQIDESLLTGESQAVEKKLNAAAFASTLVVNGQGIGVVTAIGKKSKVGEISETLRDQRPPTDFEKGIASFSGMVAKLTLSLVAGISIFNVVYKHDLMGSLLFGVAMAIGLTPELLPMIVTVNLSKGALRMAKKGVIVKHLPAIQNFGSMTVLCTDKTGTLTLNAIELERYENASAHEDSQILRAGYLNSHHQSGQKNQMDIAVLKHHEAADHSQKKVSEIAFDYERRRVSVIVAAENGRKTLICKGAPESVLPVCVNVLLDGHLREMTAPRRKQLMARFAELGSKGFRVLAVAERKIVGTRPQEKWTVADENHLTFLGFMAFFDPPKHDVKNVLTNLAAEGVSVKIITGDTPAVTQHICEQVGLTVFGEIDGPELEKLSDIELKERIQKVTLFCRVNPLQKQRIIRVLQQAGEVVGYIGDGINDAPALRTADVGISVSNAVDVAKETADMIMVTKSLRVLRDGVLEGRKTFINTMKYIMMSLGSNFGNMLSVCLASLFLPFLPLLPIQLLLNDFIYDLSQLSLSFDHADEDQLQKPQQWDIRYLQKFMLVFGPISSIFDLATFAILLHFFAGRVDIFRTGWFVESLITQLAVVMLVRTRKIPFFKSRGSWVVISTSLLAGIVGIWFAQSAVGRWFEFVPLPFAYYQYLVFVVIAYLVMVEIAKTWFYRKKA